MMLRVFWVEPPGPDDDLYGFDGPSSSFTFDDFSSPRQSQDTHVGRTEHSFSSHASTGSASLAPTDSSTFVNRSFTSDFYPRRPTPPPPARAATARGPRTESHGEGLSHQTSVAGRQRSFGHNADRAVDRASEAANIPSPRRRRSPSQDSFASLLASSDVDSMPPAARRRRRQQHQQRGDVTDLTASSPPPPASPRAQLRGVTRPAENVEAGRSAKRSRPAREDDVEELDLTNEAPSAEEELLRAEQEKAVKAQQPEQGPTGPLKIGQMTCIICMETYTNATVTHCGHIYCHECLTQALKAGEKNSDRGVGTCPVCRKPVKRKKTQRAPQIIPIAFMKQSAFKGQARNRTG